MHRRNRSRSPEPRSRSSGRSSGRSRSRSRSRRRSRSRSNSDQEEKSIVIGVRTHGHIGIKWMGPEDTPTIPVDEIVYYKDKPGQLTEFNILSTSKIGGICVGNPDLKAFIRILHTYFSYTKGLNMEDYIDHVFVNPSEDRKPPEIEEGVSSSVLGRSRTPMRSRIPMRSMKHYLESLITHSHRPVVYPIQGKYINKCYTPLTGDQKGLGGFYLLHSYNVSDTDISKIETKLSQLTTHLNSKSDAFIFRNQVCDVVEGLDINKLTLCDFTCDVFMVRQDGDKPHVTESMAQWLIKPETHIGKKKKKKKKKKKRKKKHLTKRR